MTLTVELTEVADQAFTFLMEAPTMPQVDLMLQRLNASSHLIEVDALAMWLRVTYEFAPELPAWKPLYDQTTLLCNLSGVEPADLLYGLNKG